MIVALTAIEAERKSFQSTFVHIPLGCFPAKDDNPDTLTLWKLIHKTLDSRGVLWCCINNNPTPNGLDAYPLELVGQLQTLKFYTRNIVLWYNKEYQLCSTWFKNRYTYILFLTKDAQDYKFNIDAVREPHIWKDYEWGGGRRSRYNPLGKNPSNFWLRTASKQGKILEHIPLTWSDMVKRCLQTSTEPGDHVLGIVPENRDFLKTCNELRVNPQLIEMPPETLGMLASKHDVPVEYCHFDTSPQRVYYKSSESMSEIRDSEIQVVVTSPPYWGLRDYGVSQQIGFGESYSTYISRLERVWAECFRVLRGIYAVPQHTSPFLVCRDVESS